MRLSNKDDYALHMILTAVLMALLHKYSGSTDIILGAPIYKQDNDTKGDFVNTVLAIRSYIDGSATFKDILLQVKQAIIEADENQNYPIEKLLNQLNLPSSGESFPLFDIALLLENVHDKKYLRSIKLNLIFSFKRVDECINAVVEYNSSWYEKTAIERIVSLYTNLIEQVLTNTNLPIFSIELLSEAEKQQILFGFNNTGAGCPEAKTLQNLFVGQVAKKPGGKAVVFKDRQLTYLELDKRTDLLAGILREKGIKEEVVVGIMVERSMAMIIGIFGILKAGGVYLPVSPESSERRKRYMLRDSSAALLLSAGGTAGESDQLTYCGVENVSIEETPCRQEISLPEGSRRHAARTAYIIYTPGAAGQSGGVMMEHGAIVNRLNWMQRCYPIGEADVILQEKPYVFDVSIWELFWWSFTGATLALLAPGDEKKPGAIIEAIEKHGITTLHFVPFLLKVFLNFLKSTGRKYGFAGLRRVFSSGGPLKKAQVELFHSLMGGQNGAVLVNLYGPGEAAPVVSCYNCLPSENRERTPAGKPIDNVSLYILDNNLQLQLPGVIGELCIAGAGLARGYINRPELTAEKFIKNPLPLTYAGGPGRMERIYKNGDLARWLPEGIMELSGRKGSRAKLRGIMIDADEIEKQLLDYPGIKAAMVISKEEEIGDIYLCAYYSCAKEIPAPVLWQYLHKELPDYAIPNFYVWLDKIPLTPDKKIIPGELPEPDRREPSRYEPPQNTLQEKLVDIWAQVFETGKDKIGIRDSFFAFGGHSLKILEFMELANDSGITIAYEDIFRCRTIAELEEYIVSNTPAERNRGRGLGVASSCSGSFNPDFSPDNYPGNYPCLLSIVREKLKYEHKYNISKGVLLTIDGSALMGLGYAKGDTLEEKLQYMHYPYGELAGFLPSQKAISYSIKGRIFSSFEEQMAFCMEQMEQKKVVILTGSTYFLSYTPDYLLDKELWLRKMAGIFSPDYNPALDQNYGRMMGHVFMLADITKDGYIVYDSTYNYYGKVYPEDLRRAVKGNSAIECSKEHFSYNAYRSYGILELEVAGQDRPDNEELEMQILEKTVNSYLYPKKLKFKTISGKYVAFIGLSALKELICIIKTETKNKGNSGYLSKYVTHIVNSWYNKLLFLEVLLQDISNNFDMPVHLLHDFSEIIRKWGVINGDLRNNNSMPGSPELFLRCQSRLHRLSKELAGIFKELKKVYEERRKGRA
jgi:amino acid adenylation domain-containing protein